jgi:hypothetical protein
MAVIEIAKIRVRRGQENQTGVPQLDSGEFGWAQDTEHLYIGKRIAEGAVDDQNTRILTTNDLDNIFSLLGSASTATVNTIYQYREAVSYISTASQPRILQSKLDDNVSLADFGVVPSSTATDITYEFRQAVDTLFKNSTYGSFNRSDARRKLSIPAGNYYLSNVIELPPYTSIVGEGAGLTKLTLLNNNSNMFKTIDADGNDFETDNMQSGAKRAREVYLAGMTLEYNNTSTSSYALLALDNVLNATVEDVTFRTGFNSTSTTTYGLVNWGIGIQLRGTGGGLGSGDTNLCENIQVDRCTFDSLYRGVQGTGTVIRTVMSNNIFSNLMQGVALYSTDTLPGPMNAHISQNRFENVVQEGIYIGENPNRYRTNHVSDNNFFIQVGNGLGLDDFTTSEQYPVIYFGSQGNKSENDYFQRKTLGSTNTDASFYFNPLVMGSVYIKDSAMSTASLAVSTVDIPLVQIPITGKDQMVTMNYQLSNPSLSRKGTLLINISPDGYSAITDTYSYTETLGVEVSGVSSVAEESGPDLLAINTTTISFSDYELLSSIEPGRWYITGDQPEYINKSAFIVSAGDQTGDILKFSTQSSSPQFDFSLPGEYTFLYQDTESAEFTVQVNTASNYVRISGSNLSLINEMSLEYQTDIIT